MKKPWSCLLLMALALLIGDAPQMNLHAGEPAALAPAVQKSSSGKFTALRFEVTVAKGMLTAPQDGRLLVVLLPVRDGSRTRTTPEEPRLSIGRTGLDAPPVLACDLNGLTAEVVGVLDQSAEVFPLEHLSALAPGDYFVQAIFDVNIDLKFPNSPGTLYSKVHKTHVDPAKAQTVRLELTQQVPPEALPADTQYVKYLKIASLLLSKFHGRPMYLRAAVILPRDYEREPGRRYPLRVHIGGYGTRFTSAAKMLSGFRDHWLAEGTPRLILLHLDGAGPYGDPYQVNSANQGPYGDAVTRELIPHVEHQFRAIGQPRARVLDGASTGGWVSLALQVFYPDFFNGAWSQCPDPVDFRAYELMNIYQDDNAYVNRHGFERPAMRQVNGDVRTTMRHECQIENVLGRGGLWTLSGKDWCAWNATFGPRGPDGQPRPLWHPRTGRIDRSVTEHWKQYDLRLVLETNWKTLGPKLHGKIHIWVGEADDYFLNNAVHLLDTFLKRADPPSGCKIVYGHGMGHTTGWSEQEILTEMAAAVAKARR